MDRFVTDLLEFKDESPITAFDKIAALIGAKSDVTFGDTAKTADLLEKVARAIQSGQVNFDQGLRDLFLGDEDDEAIARENVLEDEYMRVTNQPGSV